MTIREALEGASVAVLMSGGIVLAGGVLGLLGVVAVAIVKSERLWKSRLR